MAVLKAWTPVRAWCTLPSAARTVELLRALISEGANPCCGGNGSTGNRALVPPRTMRKLAASSRLLLVLDYVASALCSPPREDGTIEDPVDGICFDAILVPPMWFRRTNYRLHRGAGLDRRRPGKTELPAAAVPWRRVGLHDGLTCTPPDYTTSLAKL
ncbi:hypothetical protein JMJ77_0004978 [Colletotrichum scovillei]|uniref:Uncharacterized protein n=1 Tax=Colletotrichum scovillei TaxID=1209932 RepID=A0A9P7UHQ5_9PEZI|nr:hypothetical protein JMJ77_0004978 [Colletotrichum scovillei]KAG7076190.1 hypothetical protein JMJ76_0013457 [Colletotrichum scovillei]KAG7083193.1 hypothetical protein JMJ78_0008643 [Colletotrichum scovillei]